MIGAGVRRSLDVGKGCFEVLKKVEWGALAVNEVAVAESMVDCSRDKFKFADINEGRW